MVNMDEQAKDQHTGDEEVSVAAFLHALGSSAPTPGGGAASALAGAIAAALAEMVARLTTGRPKFARVQERVQGLLDGALALRAELLDLMDEDARAYAGVAAAYKLAKGTDEQRATREASIQRALGAAMQPPLGIMERGRQVLLLAAELAEIGNPTVASDAGCAAILAEAAVRSAALNVLANVALLRDKRAAEDARRRVDESEAQARVLCERTMAAVRARMGLPV